MNLHIYIKYTDSLHVQLWYHSCYSTHVNSVQYVICFDIRNSTSSRKEKKTQQYSQSFKVHVIQYTADDTNRDFLLQLALPSATGSTLCYTGSTLCYTGSTLCYTGSTLCYTGSTLCYWLYPLLYWLYPLLYWLYVEQLGVHYTMLSSTITWRW